MRRRRRWLRWSDHKLLWANRNIKVSALEQYFQSIFPRQCQHKQTKSIDRARSRSSINSPCGKNNKTTEGIDRRKHERAWAMTLKLQPAGIYWFTVCVQTLRRFVEYWCEFKSTSAGKSSRSLIEINRIVTEHNGAIQSMREWWREHYRLCWWGIGSF